MSTDLRDRTSSPSPGDEAEEKPKSSLSITQVIGGALAAMTAAALGSRLSVGGTVVGAALASIVAAVAGAIYTSSLRRTSQHVSTVWKTRVRPDGRGGTTVVTEAVTEETVDGGRASAEETRVLPAWADVEAGEQPAPVEEARRSGIRWKPVLLGALLMFALAAVALTGLELATGRALSGGGGTTVGQVTEGRSEPTTKPSARASAKPTATRSATATAEPTPTASSTPSNQRTAEPTPTLSARPTPSATAAPSATPTSTPRVGASAPAASATPS